jgi:hypothetical protein
MANIWGLLDGCGVCPVCRRVIPGDKPCDVDGAVVRPIASPEDKQVLVDAVWGTPARRAELVQQLATRTATARIRLVAGLALGAASMVVANVLGVINEGAIVFAGLMGAAVGTSVRPPRRIVIPSGGAAIAPAPRFAAGRILPCDAVVAPGSDVECAAWALELRYDGRWGSRITLRAGASAGFDVALDGGELLRIPAGPLWILDVLPQLAELEAPSLEELLRALDPTRSGDPEPWPLFPFNVISEQTFHAGDRIEILGAMDRELVLGQPDATYREAPASVLVPRAVPALRLIAPR